MKELKVIIVAVAITCLIMVSCAFAMPATAESYHGMYPRTAIVKDIDEEAGLVFVEDHEGLCWCITDRDDWQLGDIVSLLMWDNNTPDWIEDDEIVIALYGGYVDGV